MEDSKELQKAQERMIQTAKDAGCPKDQVEQFLRHGYVPLPWQWQFHGVCRDADRDNGPVDIGVGGARGPGKRIADYTPVLTDTGWKEAKEITLEDKLVSIDGSYTKVKAIHPSNHGSLYRLTFSDGATCDADAEHLWRVYDNKKGVWRVKTTQELIKTGIHKGKTYLWSIPLLEKPAPGNSYDGPDPYLAGYILGNGTLTGRYVTIYSDEEDLVDYLTSEGWYAYRYPYSTCWMVQHCAIGEPYRDLLGRCVGDQKKIPAALLHADPNTRLAVLQGLLDSDGHCEKNGRVSFKSVSLHLAEAVQYLVRSLGGAATLHKKNRRGDSLGRPYIYQVNISHANSFMPFRLPRKAERVKEMRGIRRSIRSIEKIDDGPARCFEVEHPSHLFVIKDFILTHNSHAVLAQIALDDCQRIPHLKALFLRQTGISAKESFEDLIFKVIHGKAEYSYNRASNTLVFPNGSKILLGGFKDDKDIDKYIGIEYDLIAIEELNQLTEDKVIRLRGSLRTSKDAWRPRMYTSFNPGGVGHQYVKDRYINPHKASLEKETRFVPSTYRDNKFVNKEYVEYLESLSGDLGKAWREGEWELFAGQYFAEWRYDIHVCEPFEIPKQWKRFIMGDYGYNAPSAVYWAAISPDERLYIYREIYQTNLTYSQLVDEIVSNTPDDERIDYWVFDPAIWAHKGEAEHGLSGAEIMQARYHTLMSERNKNLPVEIPQFSTELILKRGMNERIIGWQKVREYLKPYEKDGKTIAKLCVFNKCSNLIRTFPQMIYDDKKVEDLDSNQDDHGVDAVRYGINSNPTPFESLAKLEDRFFNLRMKAKKLKQKEKQYKLKSFYG